MKKHSSKLLKFLIVILLIFFFPILVLYFFFFINVRSTLQVEYGDNVTWNNILKNDFNLNWKSNIPFTEFQSVGQYDFNITIFLFSYSVHLQIKDTTSPEVEVKSISQYIDEELPTAEDFIISVEEISGYEVEPIVIEKKIGKQFINIKVVDLYGNSTSKETFIELTEYKELPVFSGLEDLVIEFGDSPNLRKNVSVKDNRFGWLDFSFDDSKVNYNKSGTYQIEYEAINPLGNRVTAKRNLIIKEKPTTYQIKNFPTYSQYPKYPNGCESIALYTLLKFYNINVTPEEIVENLKKGSGPYWQGGILYGGDPELEFVGDPRDLHGYGVFQKPIIDVANLYKKNMIDFSGHSLDDVLAIVKKGIPVQVWVSINLNNTKKCTSWVHPTSGKKIDWICNLHSVVITGYNSKKVIVSDPYVGDIVEYNISQFEKMYNLFGKRAIYYGE